MRMLIILILVLFCTPSIHSQSVNRATVVKMSIDLGLSGHSPKLMNFPLQRFHVYRNAIYQESKIGYRFSISGLRKINKYVSIGLSSNISKFGFTESGNESYFWSNNINKYIIEREFFIYGFGITGSLNILKRRLNKLSIYSSIEYDNIISTKGIEFWIEEGERSKYSTTNSIEYGHRVSTRTYLVLGLSATIGLRDYFENVSYKPFSYGLTVGVEVEI